MKIKGIEVDDFIRAYLTCALWSSMDNNGTPLDYNRGLGDFTRETIKKMKADCERFQEKNADLLEKAYKTLDYGHGQAGHDFWLTRCGHGSGYWDSNLGDIGTALTDAAHAYGESNLYTQGKRVHLA